MVEARTGGAGERDERRLAVSRPRLSLVATPIGTLDDLTVRAARALAECDVIYAEDTRRTRTLLSALAIETRGALERFDAHAEHERAGRVAEKIARDNLWAVLVSDAGSPAVSDPGALLVRACVAQGVTVDALPGACAAVVAVQLAAVPCEQGFRFVGFLPREGPLRKRALLGIGRDPLPTVLYEAPSRVRATLEDLAAVCGPERLACVARELTKRYEELRRGPLDALARETPETVLGEVVLVVAGANERAEEPGVAVTGAGAAEEPTRDVDAALDAAIAAGMKPSDAAREVARALGLRRAEVYQRALARIGR